MRTQFRERSAEKRKKTHNNTFYDEIACAFDTCASSMSNAHYIHVIFNCVCYVIKLLLPLNW